MGGIVTSGASKAITLAAQVLADRTRLDLPESLSFDEWSGVGRQLLGMERSVMWWIGDWLRFGERKYGEKYAQAADATGYSAGTLMNAKWVAESYETSLRNEKLPFGHHQVAASLPALERADVLQAAADNGWSVRDLRNEIKRRCPSNTPGPHVAPELAALNALVVAGVSHWLGVGPAPAATLIALLWAGVPMKAKDLGHITGSPVGSIHVQIHSLRQILEIEGLDCDDAGYSITESGYEECQAMLSQIAESFLEAGRKVEQARVVARSLAA